MSIFRFAPRALILLAASLAGNAFARPAMELEQIRTQQQQIQADVLAVKGRYADMPPEQRSALVKKQNELLKLIEGKTLESELSEKQKLEAFNALEWIEASINNSEDDRMVCKSERPTGSNRSQKVCKTVRQMREEREASRNMIDRRAVCSEGQMCAGK